MLFLTACTTTVQVRGRYAAALSPDDIKQIRRLVQNGPHLGQTLITLDAIHRGRVHVRTQEYKNSGWSGINMYVIRRDRHWKRDDRYPSFAEAERRIIVY